MSDNCMLDVRGPFQYVIPQPKPQHQNRIGLQSVQHGPERCLCFHPLAERRIASRSIPHKRLHKIVERDLLKQAGNIGIVNPSPLPSKHVCNLRKEREPAIFFRKTLRMILDNFYGHLVLWTIPL